MSHKCRKTSSTVPFLLSRQEASAWSQLVEALPALGNEEELALRGAEAKTARPWSSNMGPGRMLGVRWVET